MRGKGSNSSVYIGGGMSKLPNIMSDSLKEEPVYLCREFPINHQYYTEHKMRPINSDLNGFIKLFVYNFFRNNSTI